jgi:DNA-binding transcriptional regulator LsrR (DeoR family)
MANDKFGPDLDPEHAATLVEVARMHFEHGISYEKIAEHKKVDSATTIANWIKHAKKHGIVRTIIVPPPSVDTLDDVKKILAKKGVTTITVAPPGSSEEKRNIYNISFLAAQMIVEQLLRRFGSEVTLAISCGNTVRRTVEFIIDILKNGIILDSQDRSTANRRRHKEIRDFCERTKLTIVPTTILGDYQLNYMYPHTLVTAAYIALTGVVRNLNCFTPTLPKHFYAPETTQSWRATFLRESEISAVVDIAKGADLIVTGVGVTTDAPFTSICEEIKKSGPIPDFPTDTPEICYVPMPTNGLLPPAFESGIIGIKPADLIEAVGHGKWVCALAGGEEKRGAMRALFSAPQSVCNVLVTDQVIMEHLRPLAE